MNLSSFIFVEIYCRVSFDPQHGRQQGHSKNTLCMTSGTIFQRGSGKQRKRPSYKIKGKHPKLFHNP